jgi:hypothetical protein
MAGPPYDFAVIGSTPFAALLAGSLARDHNKRVLRVGRRPSPQRLPRRLDLALPLATRPQRWAMLVSGEAETRAAGHGMGAAEAIVPIDVMVRGDTEATLAWLSHIAHIAAGYGLGVRAVAGGWIFRGVPLLRPERLEDKLGDWLASAGVTTADPDETRIEHYRAGARLVQAGDRLEVAQIVLADDAAIIDQPEEHRPAGIAVQQVTATMTESIKQLRAPVQLFPDRRVTHLQRPGGGVLALVDGEAEIDARLASTFDGPFPIARLAAGRSHSISSLDGAPLVGRLKSSRLFAIAGLGEAGAFLALATARFLAGASADEEKLWFAAHDPAGPREMVAELAN